MNGSIKGVGCDIVSVSRIAKLIVDQRFLDNVYTVYEHAYISEKGTQTAAGLWAAKEAVSKALGTGFVGFTAKDIEIRHNESGAPQIVLYNGAKTRAESIHVKNIYISISHEKEQALAFAVIE